MGVDTTQYIKCTGVQVAVLHRVLSGLESTYIYFFDSERRNKRTIGFEFLLSCVLLLFFFLFVRYVVFFIRPNMSGTELARNQFYSKSSLRN